MPNARVFTKADKVRGAYIEIVKNNFGDSMYIVHKDLASVNIV